MKTLTMIPRIMATSGNHHGTATGTAGGTLLTLIASIQSGDITKTIVLATVGAVVSFVVSLGLKWIARSGREAVEMGEGSLRSLPFFFRRGTFLRGCSYSAIVHHFIVKMFQLSITEPINTLSVPKLFKNFLEVGRNIFCNVFNNFFRSSLCAVFWKAVNMCLYYFL